LDATPQLAQRQQRDRRLASLVRFKEQADRVVERCEHSRPARGLSALLLPDPVAAPASHTWRARVLGHCRQRGRAESLVAVQALASAGQWIRRSNKGFQVVDQA
jgi:hypothetical protein